MHDERVKIYMGEVNEGGEATGSTACDRRQGGAGRRPCEKKKFVYWYSTITIKHTVA